MLNTGLQPRTARSEAPRGCNSTRKASNRIEFSRQNHPPISNLLRANNAAIGSTGAIATCAVHILISWTPFNKNDSRDKERCQRAGSHQK